MGSQPMKKPTITIAKMVADSATRMVNAITVRRDLPLSRYMKNSPLKRLMTTRSSRTNKIIFIALRAR